MPQEKTVKVGGYAKVIIDGDKLIIAPEGGLIAVAVADLKGNAIYMHHPLSGWYLEIAVDRHDDHDPR